MGSDESRVSCAVCGRRADPVLDRDPPLAWGLELLGSGEGRQARRTCPACTRDNVRAIEAKLEQQWW